MPDITFNGMISVGGILFAALSAWFAVKYGQAALAQKNADQDEVIHNILRHIKSLWEKKDASVEEMAEAKHQLKYIARDVEELREEAKYQRRKSDAKV